MFFIKSEFYIDEDKLPRQHKADFVKVHHTPFFFKVVSKIFSSKNQSFNNLYISFPTALIALSFAKSTISSSFTKGGSKLYSYSVVALNASATLLATSPILFAIYSLTSFETALAVRLIRYCQELY